MTKQPLRVLLADDEASLRKPLARYLSQTYDYQVDTAADAQEILTWLEEKGGDYDVILIDDLLTPKPGQAPEPLGVVLTKEIKSRYPDIEIIVFTGWGMKSALETLRAGAYRYLAKPFNSEELGLLIQTAADHRRLKGIAREKQILEQLMKTSPALLSGQSLSEVLDVILRGVQASGFDRVRLYLLSEDKQTMVGRAQAGMSGKFVGFEMPVADNIHTRKLLADPRPYVFASKDEQPVPYEHELGKEDVRQWADIPLLLHREVVGKLSVDNKFNQRPISEAELGPVALFASQAAAAIENARLRAKEQEATQQAAQRARNLEAIQEVTTAISSMLELDQILGATCQAVVGLFGVEHSGLVLFTPDYEKGQVMAEYPDLGAYGLEVPVRGVPAEAQLIASQKPLVLSEVGDRSSLGPICDIFDQFDICSILIVPVVIKNQVLGSFSLDAIGHSRTFTDEEIELCQTFAAQVAVALENAQLFEQLETLRQTTLAITSELDHDILLTTIIQQAVTLLKAKSGGIYRYYPERGELTIIADYGRPENVLGHTIKVGEGIAGRLVQNDQAFIIVEDYNHWEGKALIYADKRLFGAVVEVPLKWQEQTIGILYIDDDIGRAFTADDADLLRLFADHAAIAMVNAELVARDTDKLSRLAKLAHAGSEIMGDLETMTLHDRLNLIAKHAVEILAAEACGISLVKRPGFLTLEAGFGYPADGFEKGREFAIRSGPKSGLSGHIAYEGKVFNAFGDKLINHFAVKGSGSSPLPYRKCQALLAVPLKKVVESEEKLIGLLRVENKKDKNGNVRLSQGFTQEDEWIIKLFSDAAVIAIESADLVAQLSEQKDHWARLVASSPNGVIAIDTKGKVTGFNAQAEEILRYQANEVLGKPVDFLYDDPQEPRRVGQRLHTTSDGRLANYETFVRSKEGERIPIRLAATWLYDAQGNRIGSVGYFEDLRSIKEAERRLELLVKASNTVVKAENLTEGLQSLAEMMVTFLDTTFCHISLLDESQAYLIPTAAYPHPALDDGLNWQPGLGEQIPLADWIGLAEFLREGQPTIFRSDDQQGQPLLTAWSQGLGLAQAMQSVLIIPLRTRDRVVGQLYLGELRSWQCAPFTEEKKRTAIGIANQTTVLIDRLRLHEITQGRQHLLTALDEASRNIRAEKETFKLLQEVVRLAAELVSCTAGGLYINHLQLKALELSVIYELPHALIRHRLPYDEGLVGLTARTGQPQLRHDYSHWPERENIFEPYDFKTVVGVPLKQAGEVEAVLFVADQAGSRRLTQTDLDILERFAVQASIALHTSRLLSQEQRMFDQLAFFHKISDYIQAAGDLDKILHVVLTGITAGYGLGFNRAALLLLNERREHLIGRMGIGHLDEAKAHQDWEQDQQKGLFDFGQYLKALEQGDLPPTPLGEQIRGLHLPMEPANPDVFSRVVLEGRCRLITQDELDKLPGRFIEAFEPDLPCIVVPLLARDQAIGLLVADNKFTRSPITAEDIEALLTFANTAAIAIDNIQLFQATKLAQDKLRSFYEASNALISSQDLEQVLQNIVEQARLTANATGVSIILIDEIAQIRTMITAGMEKAVDVTDLIRPNGFSMQVMRTGQPIVIEDASIQRNQINPSRFWRDIVAGLCLPVSLKGKPIGVMWVHYDKPRRFSKPETEALQLYVNQAAIAYDSARRIKELEYMRQAAEALAGVAGLQEVLEQIVQSACEVLQADSAVIWSYDAVQDRFILNRSVASGISPTVWKEFQKSGPRRGGTAYTVMKRGWVGVTDTNDLQRYGFLGESTRMLLKQIGSQSFQGIALTAGKETLGVLYVNYNDRRSFSQEEQETALIFANHATLVLKNAKLLDQVSKARNTAKAVARVTTLEDIDDTLTSVVEGTQEALGCDAVTLYVYNQQKDKVNYPPKTIGLRFPDRARRFSKIPQDSFILKILELDEIYIASDTTIDPLFKDRRFTQEEQIATCVAIILKVGPEKVGVMFVNYRTQHRFTSDELANIELFASQAAVAIRNAQLYEQAQKRADVLQALYEAGRTMTGSLKSDEILSHIVEQAWRLMGARGKEAQFSHLALINGAILRFATTYPPEYLPKFKNSIGDIDLKQADCTGITGQVAKTGQGRLVDDVTKVSGYIEGDPDTLSEVAVPIKLGNEVIGVINVEHPDHNAFDEEDQRVLELLAAQAGIAIQNARLYAQVQQRVEQFQILYQASLNLTAELSVEAVLQQVVNYARQLTMAQYGALGVLDTAGKINPFITSGMDPEQRKRIGTPPEGRGVLGLLSREPKPIRMQDIRQHPNFIGFPPHHPEMTSFLGVAVISKGSFIGQLYIANKQRASEFSQEDEIFLELLAAQAAIAMENARLFEQTQRRARLLDAAAQVARGATAILDMTRLLQRTVHLISDVFGYYHAGVFLLENHHGYAVLKATYPQTGPGMLEIGYKLKVGQEGIVGLVTKTGKAHLALDVKKHPHYKANPNLPDTQSEMVFPLIVRGEVIGALDVQSTEVVNLQDEDIATLQTMADQLANAIRNAQLYQEVTERLEEVNALQKVAVSLSGASELDEVLTLILVEAMKLTETQESSILLWDAQAEEFTRTLRMDEGKPLQPYISQARSRDGQTRKIIEEKKPNAISDARKIPDFNPAFLEKGYRASLGVPLLCRGEAIGVLYVRSREPHQFSKRQIALLEGAASQAAVAIDRASQYEELIKAQKQIGATTAVAWMGMVSSVWRHAVANDATTIEDRVVLAQQDIDTGVSIEKLRARLDDIATMAHKIREAPITAPLGTEEDVGSVSINELLQERLSQLWEREPYESVELQRNFRLNETATVRASPEWLRRAFDLLIDNAVEAMAQSPTRQLTISTQQVDRQVEIIIADTGPGIPEEVRPNLFQKPIEKLKGAQGMGMGLLITQTILHTYRGEVQIQSTDSTGTAMQVLLPLES